MEIKELTSQSKEILVRPKTQEGVFYDVFSYIIQSPDKNNQPRDLNGDNNGYLYIVSQIHSKDSSLDYVPNLIASFIKRELESSGLTEKNHTFENSLKKTNELIEGLIKNNSDLKLELGVAFLGKEKISLSKIGKAKLLVHRPAKEEIFDVFENVTQFSKLHLNNKRFSNIISGEVKKDDKFFFFIPNIRLNLKQKLITAALSRSGQEDFANNVHKIISPKDQPVPCCGIYFEIKEEVRKIANEPVKEKALLAPAKETQITATEVSKIDKGDAFKKTAGRFKDMILGENSRNNWNFIPGRGINGYIVLSVILILVIAGLTLIIRNSGFKEEASAINEKLRVSESRFLLKQNYEARKVLEEVFQELNVLKENKGKNEAVLAAINLLNRIEKVNPAVQPSILIDLTFYQNIDLSKINGILASAGRIFINDSEKMYLIQENEAKPIEESGNIILSWVKDDKIIIYGANIKIIDLGKNKVSELRKKFNFEPVGIKNYEDNLYLLGSKNIYKISNALVNPIEELEWLKSGETAKIPGNFISFDLDSSIYVITDERKMAALYKGKLEKLNDLEFDVRPGMEFVNLGSPEKSPGGDNGAGNEFMVAEKDQKLARIIDASGEVKISYGLSEIDEIKDFFFDKQARTLYILSPTKIWSLKI